MAQTKLMWSNLGPIRANMALDHVPKQAQLFGDQTMAEQIAAELRERYDLKE